MYFGIIVIISRLCCCWRDLNGVWWSLSGILCYFIIVSAISWRLYISTTITTIIHTIILIKQLIQFPKLFVRFYLLLLTIIVIFIRWLEWIWVTNFLIVLRVICKWFAYDCLFYTHCFYIKIYFYLSGDIKDYCLSV